MIKVTVENATNLTPSELEEVFACDRYYDQYLEWPFNRSQLSIDTYGFDHITLEDEIIGSPLKGHDLYEVLLYEGTGVGQLVYAGSPREAIKAYNKKYGGPYPKYYVRNHSQNTCVSGIWYGG